MPNVNHRVAFNCDLFLTIEAPEEATSEDLERRVLAILEEHGNVLDEGLGVSLPGDARVWPKWEDEQLQNFTIENVEEVDAVAAAVEACGHTHYFGYGTYTCTLLKGHAGKHQQGASTWLGMFSHAPDKVQP